MDRANHIEKLVSSTQWENWKFQIQLALVGAQVMDVVDGTLTRNENNQDVFKQADNKARYIIGTAIDGAQIDHVRHCTSAKEMWDALLVVHEAKDEISRARYYAKYWNFKVGPGEGIVAAISRLNGIVAELARHDQKIDELNKIARLIDSLPIEYASFCSAWDSTPANERTYANLSQRLHVEEERRGLGGEKKVVESEALLGRSKGCNCKCTCDKKANYSRPADNNNKHRGGNKGKVDQKDGHNTHKLKCFRCGDRGHFKANCPDRNKPQSGKYSEALSSLSGAGRTAAWVMDSGASEHMSSERESFTQFKALEEKKRIVTASGDVMFAEGTGNIELLAFDGVEWKPVELKDVLFVPQIKFNLFSISQAMDKNCLVTVNNSGCVITREGRNVALGTRNGNLYHMQFAGGVSVAGIANGRMSLYEWHVRLAHQNFDQVRKMLRKHGVAFEDQVVQCESCAEGKGKRKSFGKRLEKTTEAGAVIHADLCGPLQCETLSGSKYMLVFKDEYSHYRHVYFVKSKDEVPDRVISHFKMIMRQLGASVKILRTDNGTEFVNKNVKKYLENEGIVHQTTIPGTPQQNGCVEREMQTIMDAVRSMLHSSKLEKRFWAEAAAAAVFTLNVTGTSGDPTRTPAEVWCGKSADLSELHPFGCPVYVHTQQRKKLDPKARRCVFVGYGIDKKGYRCYDPATGVVLTARDCAFFEEVRIHIGNGENQAAAPGGVVVKNQRTPQDSGVAIENREMMRAEKTKNFCDVIPDNIIIPRLRSGWRAKESSDEEYEDADEDAVVMVAVGDEPQNFRQAMNGQERDEWKLAMTEEFDSLIKNKTWDVVDYNGQKLVDNRWVFKRKLDGDGQVSRYKARLVARGFSQIQGVDYNETFSPVIKYQSVRMIFAVAAIMRAKMTFFDVKTAFLNGELAEKVYMRQPDGFNDGTDRVCLLRRSLYGLKQASRCWNQKFVKVIKKFGLVKSQYDPCVFVRSNGKMLILGIYVDDGMAVAEDQEELNQLINHLKKHFEITITEGQFLGMKVVLKDNDIVISQKAYAGRVVDRFQMQDSHPVSTPIDINRTNVCSSSSSHVAFPYQEAVGCLNYLAVVSRPDIAYAVSVAGRNLQNPGPADVKAVKRILRYVKGTSGYSLRYGGAMKMFGYCDADYAGCIETGRSTSGSIFLVGSGAVSWISRRQKTTAQSTAEAEYMSAAEAAKEMVWLRGLLEEMIGTIERPTMWVDNQSAIKIINNPTITQHSKHIRVRYHYIREVVEEGIFKTEYINTKEQLADVLTKPLSRQGQEKFCADLNLMDN